MSAAKVRGEQVQHLATHVSKAQRSHGEEVELEFLFPGCPVYLLLALGLRVHC